MELMEQLGALIEKGQIPDRDLGFAKSVYAYYEGKGFVTPKQEWAIDRLVQRIVNPPPADRIDADLSGVHSFLLDARKHLKWPKLILRMDNGRNVKVYLSGDRSRYPDTVNLVMADEFGEFEHGEWLGRILKDGEWHHPRTMDMDAILPPLESLLSRLGDKPAEVAAEQGHLTGHCCFCNKKLDDERSTAVGYGRTCAKNFNLPWGKRK
jgi:hypothetical protein